jgi:hypothetical protein
MRKKLLSFLLIIIAHSLSAQNFLIEWDKTYGGNSRDWNCNSAVSPNGAVFIIGDSQTDINGDKSVPLCNGQVNNSDVWLIKIDGNGSILWQKSFGGEGNERSPRLTFLNNAASEMIFSCYSSSDIACDKSEANRDTIPLISTDYWIALLDSNGVLIWEKTLGGDNYDDNTDLTILTTGEILVCGESNSPVGYDKTVPNYSISNDLWTVKLDQTGNILQDFVYGGNGGESLAKVIPAVNGGFLMAGTTNSDPGGDVSQVSQGNQDFWLIYVDAQGNKVWDKRFGGAGPDLCNYFTTTNDGGFVLCGYTVSPQGGDVSQPPLGTQDYWVVKTDALGNKEWDSRYGGSGTSIGTFVRSVIGNNYWVGGYTNSINTGDVSENTYGGSDYWILKIDSVGNKLIDKRFGGSGDEFDAGMQLLNDTTFLVFGSSDSGSSAIKTAASKGWLDYWMVKYTYNDISTGIVQAEDNISDFVITPLPATETVTVKFYSTSQKNLKFHIKDIAGKEILNQIYFASSGSNKTDININFLDSGLYFLILENECTSISRKLIVID